MAFAGGVPRKMLLKVAVLHCFDLAQAFNIVACLVSIASGLCTVGLEIRISG